MSETRRFGINIVSNAGAGTLGSAAQLALLVVLARVTGVGDFAGYVSAAAIVAIAEHASDFGTRIWATKKFALHDHARTILRQALKNKLFYSSIMAVVVLALPLETLSFFDALLCILIAVTQYSTDPVNWYLTGKERIDVDAAILLAWRVGNALLLAILAFAGFSLEWLLAGWLAVNCMRILVESRLKTTRELFAVGDGAGAPGESLFSIIRLVFPIGSAMILNNLSYRLGVLLLDSAGDVKGVAVLGAAFTLVIASSLVTHSITLASFPMLSKALHLAELKRAADVARRMFFLITCVTAPICLGGLALSPFIAETLYGPAYAESGLVMIILIPALYLACVNNSLKFTLNAMRLYWQDAISLLPGLAAYAAVFFSLPQTLGVTLPTAAALGWGAGETVVFLAKWFILARDARLKDIPMGRMLALAVVFSALAWGAYAYFS